MNKTNIYLIGSDETSVFNYDIFCAKKIKSLYECKGELDAIFAKNFENLPIAEKYCSEHNIETINLEKNEQNFFYSIVRYSAEQNDKKNLAALVSEKMTLKLNLLFKLDPCFESHLI